MKLSKFLEEKGLRAIEDSGEKDGTVELPENIEELDERFIDREEMLVILEDKRHKLSEIIDELKKEVRG